MLLFPKILMYALNAYTDAQIAEELVVYLNTKGKTFATNNTATQQRAERLVATTSTNDLKKDPSYGIGLAYTEYYVNGLMDILYPNLLWPLVVSKQKKYFQGLYEESLAHFRRKLKTSYQFEELIHRLGISLWYWPLAVTDPWRWAAKFAKERCFYQGILDRNALRKAALEVQRQNIQNNHEVARMLRSNNESIDSKIIEIRRVARQIEHPEVFLSQAAATQEAAARWDKVFVRLVKRQM